MRYSILVSKQCPKRYPFFIGILMKSILLVDDSRSIRQLMSKTLQSSGYEIVEAENGQVGMEAAKSRNLDLVLTDLNMPVMDGLRFTKQVRSLPQHAKTPIILVTTESQLSKKQEAKVAGANGWIVKPIEPARLLEVVTQILNRS